MRSPLFLATRGRPPLFAAACNSGGGGQSLGHRLGTRRTFYNAAYNSFGIAGRPADFLKIAPGPIFNPRGGENRIPHAKIFRFQPLKSYFDRFLKNRNFLKTNFFKNRSFVHFLSVF